MCEFYVEIDKKVGNNFVIGYNIARGEYHGKADMESANVQP